MSYDLGRLITDVVRTRGPLPGPQQKSQRGGGYEQVWDAFNRYISDVMGKKQTLNVPNFGKVGWRIEEHSQGKAKMRPHFQAADAFARAYGLDMRSHPALADRALAHIEELHFSKAAIRYTQNMTKDGIFLGLRSIFTALGEACATGQQVSIEFEVGRFTCSERVVRFDFLAELYLKEGLEVPSEAPRDGQYRPSATFSEASPEDMATLKLSGRGDGFSAPMAHSAQLGGWSEAREAGAAPSEASTGPRPGQDALSAAWAATAAPASSTLGGASLAPSGLSVQERAHNEALERHVATMERSAAEALVEKETWEEHLRSLNREAAKEAEYRRALAKHHQMALKEQMSEADVKRNEHRQILQEMASAHDFPNFTECPEAPVYEAIRGRFNLKEDLDKQVHHNVHTRTERKRQDLDQEAAHLEATRKDLAIKRLETILRKENDKAALHESWDRDRRMRSVKKAIEEYHKTPAKTSALSGGASAASGAQTARGRMSSTLPAFGEMSVGSSPLRSARAPQGMGGGLDAGASGFSMPPSRPVTGSVRRVPFGAAASLALHKEKIGTSLRR